MKTCDYCGNDENNILADTESFYFAYCKIIGNKLFIGGFDESTEKTINFCPMCGRKLKGGEDE